MDFFNAQLAKGDIEGALNTSIREAEAAQALAQSGLEALAQAQARVTRLADEARAKYPLL